MSMPPSMSGMSLGGTMTVTLPHGSILAIENSNLSGQWGYSESAGKSRQRGCSGLQLRCNVSGAHVHRGMALQTANSVFQAR